MCLRRRSSSKRDNSSAPTTGLHTLDQVPLMQQALANQQAIGNFSHGAGARGRVARAGRRDNPDDLRAAAIHRDAGRRRVGCPAALSGGRSSCRDLPGGGIYSFWRDDVIKYLASDAQIHYADAAAVMLRNGLYASDELRDLEMQIVRASDMVRQRSRCRRTSRGPSLSAGTMQQNRFSTVRSPSLPRGPPLYNPALVQRMNTLWDLASSAGLQDAPAVLQNALGVPRGGGYHQSLSGRQRQLLPGHRLRRSGFRRLCRRSKPAQPAGSVRSDRRLGSPVLPERAWPSTNTRACTSC